MCLEVIFQAFGGQSFLGAGIYCDTLRNGSCSCFVYCGLLVGIRNQEFDPFPHPIRTHSDMFMLFWQVNGIGAATKSAFTYLVDAVTAHAAHKISRSLARFACGGGGSIALNVPVTLETSYIAKRGGLVGSFAPRAWFVEHRPGNLPVGSTHAPGRPCSGVVWDTMSWK